MCYDSWITKYYLYENPFFTHWKCKSLPCQLRIVFNTLPKLLITKPVLKALNTQWLIGECVTLNLPTAKVAGCHNPANQHQLLAITTTCCLVIAGVRSAVELSVRTERRRLRHVLSQFSGLFIKKLWHVCISFTSDIHSGLERPNFVQCATVQIKLVFISFHFIFVFLQSRGRAQKSPVAI